MRRILRQLLASLLLPFILAAALLLAVNTGPGRQLVAWAVEQTSGGRVVAVGLGGALPFAPRLARLELRDATGAWLRIEDAELAVDAGGLLRGELTIESLTARSVSLARLPARDQDATGPVRLPLRVVLRHLAIQDLSLEQVAPGAPRLAVEGDAAAIDRGDVRAAVRMTAPGRGDRYELEGGIAAGRTRLLLSFREAPDGLIGALAGAAGLFLPTELDTWTLKASAAGPLDAVALSAVLDAGALTASADGLLDLESRSAARLRLRADLPAMAIDPSLGPELAWQRIQVGADLRGPLGAPQGSVHLEADGLAAGGLVLDRLSAAGQGDAVQVRLNADIQGLRSPLDLPESMTSLPVRIAAELKPQEAGLPFRISVRHPLADLLAVGKLTDRAGHGTLRLPDLGAFGALVGTSLAGSAVLELQGTAAGPARLNATGDLRLTHGPGPIARLLGPVARLAAAVRRDGAGWQIDSARLDGAGVSVSTQGRAASDALALGWILELPDLTALVPDWSGRISARGGLTGPPRSPDLAADLTASSGSDRVTGHLSARLAAPHGSLDLTGVWAGQPVAAALAAGRSADGSLGVSFGDSHWASIAASGALQLPPGAALPRGEVRLSAGRLSDLAPLLSPLFPTGQPGIGPGPDLAGRLNAHLTLTAAGSVVIAAQGEGLTLPGAVGLKALALDARVTEPLGTADTDAIVQLAGLSVGGIAGDLALAARGPAAALELTLEAGLASPAGPAKLAAAGRLDAPARRLALRRLEAQVQGQTLRLLEPAVLELAGGVAVDRLRLGLAEGTIEVAGRLTPRLDLDASISHLPLDLTRLVAPDLPLAGVLGAQVRLTGSLDAPTGSIRAKASGVRLAEGAPNRAAWRSLPPAQVEVSTTLGAQAIEIDAWVEIASRARLRVRGRIDGTPRAPGTLALQTNGQLDLALLDPLLTGSGRQARGQTRLDASVAGTLAAPRMDGRLTLADGALWDRTIGLALTGIGGSMRLAGDTLRVERLTAQAGRGTIALEGSIGALAPGIPVDLRLVARNARPLQLDLLDAEGDAELRLHGRAAEALTATGTVRLSRAEIRLPERLPAAVATLEVRERGRRDHPNRTLPRTRSAVLGPDLGLDLRLAAPRAVFVRGRGIDAELGGEARLRGTLREPTVSGGFDLLRGQFELVGQTLRFSRGRLDFDGAAGLNPTLDLEARVSAAGSTAILAVLGTASAPRIALRGEPELPEDEVLSRLLFGVAGGRLSGLQAVRLGMAAASLAGIETGDGLGVLDQARSGLGLDRLSLGTDERGGATLEGGRHIAERVYLGARQGTRAGETQGVLRIEVSPRIKLEADVGATGGTRGGGAFEHEY